MSAEPMLTTDNPSAFADVITRLLFSVCWNALMGLGAEVAGPDGMAEGALALLGLLRTRSSIVSGTESLMSLAKTRPSARDRSSAGR